MRNVSHILEKQLTDYLVTDQARFYRLAYSYLKNREEALDAVQTAVCRALEKQGIFIIIRRFTFGKKDGII